MPNETPKFDPSKPVYVEPKFDPNAPIQRVTPQREITEVESGLLGAGQSLAMGFGDEAIGAISAALSDDPEPWKDKYRKKQKEIEAYLERAQAENPKSYMAGSVAGAVGSALTPWGAALAPTKVAGVASNIGRAALYGGLQAAGESKHTLEEGAAPIGEDVLKGAAIGGATQGLFEGAGSALRNITPTSLRGKASERAFKAASGQNVREFKKAYKTGQLTGVGDLLKRDEAGAPVVGWLSKAEDIAPKAAEKSDYFGKKIGDVAMAIDEQIPKAIDGEDIASKIIAYHDSIPGTPKNEPVRNALLREAEFYMDQGRFSFADAQKLKNTYKFKTTDSTTQVLGQDATNEVRKIVSDSMDETAEAISKSEVPQQIKDLIRKYGTYKRKYGVYETAQKVAEDRTLANLSNRFVSPSDYGTGFAGVVGSMMFGRDPLTSMAIGAAASGANKFARERGSAFAARGMNAAADLMEKTPQAIQSISSTASNAVQQGGLPLGAQQAIRQYLEHQFGEGE